MAREMEDICTSCPACQKACLVIRSKNPLYHLLVITEPFERIAMDMFGPT